MKLPKRDEGQGLVEYALLLVLVAIVVIGILGLMGGQVRDTFTNIVNVLAGGGAYSYNIQSFTVSRSPAPGGNCKYTANASVKVTDSSSGAPVADGTSVTGNVSGAASMSVSGSTSGGSGVASMSNSATKSGACPSSGSATLSIGGESQTYTW